MKCQIQIVGRVLFLILTVWGTVLVGFAQQKKNSTAIHFKAGSDVLVGTYKENAAALHWLDTVVRENKRRIMENQAYIRLVSGVSSSSLSDNQTLNIAAIQASVVRAFLKTKYGLMDNHFLFYFSKDFSCNEIQVTYNAQNTSKDGSEKIFYTLNKMNVDAVNAAIGRYGSNIPMYINDVSQGYAVEERKTAPTSSDNVSKERLESYSIDFRYGSETLYASYLNNKKMLSALKSNITNNRSLILQQKGHLRIVSVIPEAEQGNIAAINFASIRGAVVRQWLRDNFLWLTESDFSFYISAEGNRNSVEVSLMDTPIEDKQTTEIFFSLDKNYPEKVDFAVARYKRIPFLDGSKMFDRTGMDFNIVDPALDPNQVNKKGSVDEKMFVTIYYRWDKDNLDKTYLTNTQTLFQIDSLLHLKSADYIDSLRIVAYASPEGPPNYNKRLSQRRANTLKNYLLSTYPRLRDDQIITEAKGENWDGFKRMAEADANLPMKEQVLHIINNTEISDLQRQSQIAKLDGGRVYKNYILPNYYRYLRTGASLFLVYNIGKPIDIDFDPIKIAIKEPSTDSKLETHIVPFNAVSVRYPIALRSNLLYDAVLAMNLGIEVPIGKNWSWIVDGAYSYWRSPQNLFALQTLEYGTELRYWFASANKSKEKNSNWIKPLKGWNLGIYGRYWQRYDVQAIDGVQGDGSWSAGITVGYAFPISRHLSLEASVGGGWLATDEYRHYHSPEYDEYRKYHLMWQQTGRWSGLTLTKVRFSLVWLIEYQNEGLKK